MAYHPVLKPRFENLKIGLSGLPLTYNGPDGRLLLFRPFINLFGVRISKFSLSDTTLPIAQGKSFIQLAISTPMVSHSMIESFML